VTTRRKVGPAAYEVVEADGTVLGRYGGRPGDRWADLADGSPVVEGSRCSATTVRSILERTARERRATLAERPGNAAEGEPHG
jgi:hypothetical protein